MTIKQAAQQAIAIQNGCNLSGIAISFAEVLTEAIWPEARRTGKGTQWVNMHPIATLFISKLCDLNRYRDSFMEVSSAYDLVQRMAEDIPCEDSAAAAAAKAEYLGKGGSDLSEAIETRPCEYCGHPPSLHGLNTDPGQHCNGDDTLGYGLCVCPGYRPCEE